MYGEEAAANINFHFKSNTDDPFLITRAEKLRSAGKTDKRKFWTRNFSLWCVDIPIPLRLTFVQVVDFFERAGLCPAVAIHTAVDL